jgi:hypothetical protein
VGAASIRLLADVLLRYGSLSGKEIASRVFAGAARSYGYPVSSTTEL